MESPDTLAGLRDQCPTCGEMVDVPKVLPVPTVQPPGSDPSVSEPTSDLDEPTSEKRWEDNHAGRAMVYLFFMLVLAGVSINYAGEIWHDNSKLDSSDTFLSGRIGYPKSLGWRIAEFCIFPAAVVGTCWLYRLRRGAKDKQRQEEQEASESALESSVADDHQRADQATPDEVRMPMDGSVIDRIEMCSSHKDYRTICLAIAYAATLLCRISGTLSGTFARHSFDSKFRTINYAMYREETNAIGEFLAYASLILAAAAFLAFMVGPLPIRRFLRAVREDGR